MSTQSDKLLAKADEFQKKADALRYAAEVLNESGTASVVRRMPTALATALAMREEARAWQGNGASATPTTPKPPRGAQFAKSKQTRRATAKLLAKFNTKTPKKHVGGPRISVLVQHGYLIRAANGGYVRTAKPFDPVRPPSSQAGYVRPSRPHKRGYPSELKKAQARDEKARIVATILKERGPMSGHEVAEAARQFGVTNLTGIYAYVQRGYITKEKSGKHGNARYAFKAMPPEANANGAEATNA